MKSVYQTKVSFSLLELVLFKLLGMLCNHTFHLGQNCKCKNCNSSSLKLLRRSSIIVINSEKLISNKDPDTSLLEEYAGNSGKLLFSFLVYEK